jgi:hypothetical protein
VERLCTRESRRIAYSPAELRRAVGAVAAVLQLFDLRAVAVESLSDVGEPLLENATMSRRLLHDAALRLLSTGEDEGTFAFLSSALTAFLAADHILRVDPDATSTLSAVAPAIGHDFRMASPEDGSELVARVERSGIRSDLRELASILAARSDAWADALWALDPLLVARVAPASCARPDAPVRARELWDAIQAGDGTGWWFPESRWLPEPEAALGALLRDRPFPRLERELVSAALSAGDKAGPAVVAMATTGRLAPRTLTRIAQHAPQRQVTSILRAVRIARSPDLIGPILQRQLSTAAAFEPTALEEVSHMVAECGAGSEVIDALVGADPYRAGKPFWDLVGVVRVAGNSGDVVQLWIMLLTEHHKAFEQYAADNWMVIMHLISRLYPATYDHETVTLNDAGHEAVMDFIASLKGTMRPIPLSLEEATAQAAGFVRTQTDPEPAQPPSEQRPTLPVLLPRCKFRRMIERMVLDLAPSETDYSSYVPDADGMIARHNDVVESPDEDLADDPVVLINELLAASSYVMSDLDGALDGIENLDAWSRRRVGVRLEEAIPALSPGSGSSRRVAFLRRWGLTLGLAPTEDEWLSLAAGEIDHSYLALHPPPLSRLRTALRGGDATVVPKMLSATPIGWRMLVLDDAIAGLKSTGAREEAVLEVASLIAEVPLRAEGIALLRKAFPQLADELAGWAAAAGDRGALPAAFASLLSKAQAGDKARVFARAGVAGWLEDALERLPPDTLEPMGVVKALPAAMKAFEFSNGAIALTEALGALAIANAPLVTASTFSMTRLIHGTEGPLVAFDLVRETAVDAAHRAAGVQAAALPLGIASDAVLGRRNLTDIDIQTRAQRASRATIPDT